MRLVQDARIGNGLLPKNIREMFGRMLLMLDRCKIYHIHGGENLMMTDRQSDLLPFYCSAFQ
jgi:hypothetical protein